MGNWAYSKNNKITERRSPFLKVEMIKSNIVLKLAALILCLVLLTAYGISGLYARYTYNASFSASASVANFSIETDLDGILLGSDVAPELELGGDDEIASVDLPFYIASESEVTVGYSVIVDFGYALPDYMSLTLAEGSHSQTIHSNGSASAFAFADFGSLSIGSVSAQRADLTLTISVADVSMIVDEISIPSAALTVHVYQID